MCHSSFINSHWTFSEVLEIELAQITTMAEHSPDIQSTSGFHICDNWSYFKSFFVNHFPYNVLPVSSADKIDTQEGKGDTQEQLVVDQEFKSYSGEKNKEDDDEKEDISGGSML
jgi:hypothetical protein